MASRTVDWTAGDPPVGLRERKKQALRQRLSDTATMLFMERGFDAVRVTEVAERCGVSEKTVYNHFPTKESLVLDRWETTPDALRGAFTGDPLDAVLRVLAGELAGLTAWLGAQPDLAVAVAGMRRFGDLIASTASLRAHQHDARERLVAVLVDLIGPPDALIVATALVGLWSVQGESLRRHLDSGCTAAQLAVAVTGDVRRAAAVLERGLGVSGGRLDS